MSEGNRLLKADFGLKNTYYASPHGLSCNMNKTTCVDMAIVLINVLKKPLYIDLICALDYRCRSRLDGIPAN